MLGQASRSRLLREYWEPRNAVTQYRRWVHTLIAPRMRVLHAGCGWDRNDITRPYAGSARIVGVDIDPRVAHRFHSSFCLASLDALPFGAGTFDLICCEYVFEHLPDPQRALMEFSRVLMPGGSALILTPNLYSYKTLVARWTPYRVHLALGRIRYGPGHEADMYPTLYRCNSTGQFATMARRAGLAVRAMALVSNGPTWFEKFPLLFELGHVFHVLTDRWTVARQLRCNLIVHLEKSTTARRAGPAAATGRQTTAS